jgi:FMN phosphatase YigB (HAD superfamily)
MRMMKNGKEKIILTDVDGVCLDWEFGFHTWMSVHGHELVDKDNYSVAIQYNVEFPKAKSLVRTFNESAAVGFLPPLRDAQYYIKMLHEKYQDQFIAITSLSLDPHAQKLRERNLSKIFGPNTFKEVVFLDCGADKDEVLSLYGSRYSDHIWVEDKKQNVDVGIACGLNGLLMEHAHNMDYTGPAKVVKNWEEIYNYVTAN